MKILMIANSFKQQYHVMRCASLGGHEVHVLGKYLSRGLSYSNYCSSYNVFNFDYQKMHISHAMNEINNIIKKYNIDIVLPSDIISTKLLILCRNSLRTKTTLLPEMKIFNLLNNKWTFYELCGNEKILTPFSIKYDSLENLKSAINKDIIKIPFVAKPLDKMGGADVIIVRNNDDISLLENINYTPILVQKYVQGCDCGLSIIAKNGKLISSLFQRDVSTGYVLEYNKTLHHIAKNIAKKLHYTGVAHFDLVETVPNQEYYFIECNPRFWYSIFAPLVVPMNFVQLAFDMGNPDDISKIIEGKKINIKINKSLFKSFINPIRLNEYDIEMMRYYMRDPVAYYFERTSIFDDQKIVGSGSLNDQINILNEIH